MEPIEFEFDSNKLGRVQIDLSKVPAGTVHLGGGAPPSGILTAVTWFSRNLIEKRGLPPASICGVLPYLDAPMDEEHFTQNHQFIQALHKLNLNSLDPDLLAFAKATIEPAVAIIDQRSTDPNGDVPLQDIIGQYSIVAGRVQGYQPNSAYRLITSQGIFKLTPWIRKSIVEVVVHGKLPRD